MLPTARYCPICCMGKRPVCGVIRLTAVKRAVIRQLAPKAQDFVNRRYRHRGVVDEVERAKNRTKSKVRARVEHSIGVIKRVFGFAKVRYRGLKKNTHRLLVTCALANLFMARRHLLRCQPA
jgi:transposase, IS5 family